MLQNYLSFNIKLLFLYLLFLFAMFIGILLTWDQTTYSRDTLFITLQIWGLLTLSNIIYLVRKRRQDHAVSGFFKMVLLIPIPYNLLAVIMGLAVVYN
ncbi:hypothetical protein FZC84_17450 [Rossellomorea vietnamensis]|uniref:Uncharacterized protein n=1 Tax=Rossellomorea vietnamensis TaxID=218284 RepID=A0A5D4M8W8_9BACI|nr:hypothetical protein [Rossellomorea vietnamensis]TYR97803.1 hypothetical protein FZC84_17450 [Rossellomorea vietnamensis]